MSSQLKFLAGALELVNSAFHKDVIDGLSGKPCAIPARWLYDRRGSELFERITKLPEYYPTRTERTILSACASHIAALIGPGYVVVEFGSGASTKTPLLLSAIGPSAYVPVDISGEFLRESVAALIDTFPGLPVFPLEGNFMHPLNLPKSIGSAPRLGFFPGSTIGNMTVPVAVDLLRSIASTLGPDAMLLIGIDRIKNTDVLLHAYDDMQGVTAEFNLNLLRRINRELQGEIPLDAFRHLARWNDREGRIEMHLEAIRDVVFNVDGRRFTMAAKETIHTENSHKFDLREARLLLRAAGWTTLAEWSDEDDFFGVFLASLSPTPSAP